MIFKTIQWCYVMNLHKSSASRDRKILEGLTKIQASVHWHSFGWNTFGWCPLFQTSKKLWRMGSPMEKRYLLLNKKTNGETWQLEKLDIPPKSMAFWNQLICSATSIQLILNQQKKSKNTPGDLHTWSNIEMCIQKHPISKSLMVYQHLPADGQRLLCSIQGKVVEDIGSFDRFRFQPLVVETECVRDVSVATVNGWTACGWSNLLEPWQ